MRVLIAAITADLIIADTVIDARQREKCRGMLFVTAVEASDGERAMGKVCAGAGAWLIAAIGAVAEVVIDLGAGNSYGWVCKAGEGATCV